MQSPDVHSPKDAPMMAASKAEHVLDVMVLVPITERHDDLEKLFGLYAPQLSKLGKTYEFLFIIDDGFPEAQRAAQRLKDAGQPVQILKFARRFGEARALMEGFRHSNAESVLTLAAYIQVEPDDIAALFAAQDDGYDLIVTNRHPRIDAKLNQLQSRIYHWLIQKLTGSPFNDITCGVRLIRKHILEELTLYGDLHRFLPIFAYHKGIRIKEINAQQRREDSSLRLVQPGMYLRRLLDILTVFFLVKFTKKPLRFFGLIGTLLFITGSGITLYLAVLRLVYQVGLANKPMLLLGILLIIFGMQLFSVGLIGELILFMHARELESYRIQTIIE